MTALETVRELHVLYGIAMTNRLTQPEKSGVYGIFADDIHSALGWITTGENAHVHLRWLSAKWEDAAGMSDERVAALYGSWAQNIKNIT